jgi:hypothetical protein
MPGFRSDNHRDRQTEILSGGSRSFPGSWVPRPDLFAPKCALCLAAGARRWTEDGLVRSLAAHEIAVTSMVGLILPIITTLCSFGTHALERALPKAGLVLR